MKSLRLHFLALAAALSVSGAYSQTAELSDWARLSRLTEGDFIVVVDAQMRRHRGSLIAVREDAIHIQDGRDAAAIARPDVFRVSLEGKKPKRTRNMLIGMGIGAGAGLATGAVASSGSRSGDARQIARGMGMFIGLGAGAAAGVAIPAKYETVYRVEKRD